MSLLPLALVVIVTFGGAVALLVALLARPIVRALDAVEPGQRARWIMAVLVAPWGVGLATIVAAWLPCLFEGRGAAARNAVEICRFCLFHPAPVTVLVWGLGLFAAAPFARAAIVGSNGARASRRVLSGLRLVARRDERSGHLWIPGTHSFVAGWPRAQAYVGEELASALAPSALEAVIAHEQAHVARGDVLLRWTARMLSAGHVPFAARTLLSGAVMLANARSASPSMLGEMPGFVAAMDATGAWEPVPSFLA
ncbi:MAG: M48 family metalloprotease, partial [Deltaproteobacteria bacterium]